MSSLIAVHPKFDGVWPFAANHFRTLWQSQGTVEFIRLDPSDQRNLGESNSYASTLVTSETSARLPHIPPKSNGSRVLVYP